MTASKKASQPTDSSCGVLFTMMEHQQHRERSSSAGQQPNRIRHSPSPQAFHQQSSPTDLSTQFTNFSSQGYPSNASPTAGPGLGYNLPPSYMNGSAHQSQTIPQQHVLPSNDFSDPKFGQYQQNSLEPGYPQEAVHINGNQSNQQFQPDGLGQQQNFGGFSQPEFNSKPVQSFENNFLDPQLDSNIQPQGSINPADLMSNMSSPQNVAPTPPNLMPPETHSSGPTSPISNHGHQWSPGHSRNASASLDPSAAFSNGQQGTEWTGMQFQGHRRAPSEYSDVSSSAAPSPFLPQQESFESFEPNPSPMLNPQQDPQIFGDNALGIGSFSISDHSQQRNSPRHSPYVSPRMTPEPGLGLAQNNDLMPLTPNNQFDGGPGSQIYTHQPEAFPSFPPEERLTSNDMGQAAQMEAPEINIELAPSTQQPTFDRQRGYSNDFDALSPPESGMRSFIVRTF